MVHQLLFRFKERQTFKSLPRLSFIRPITSNFIQVRGYVDEQIIRTKSALVLSTLSVTGTNVSNMPPAIISSHGRFSACQYTNCPKQILIVPHHGVAFSINLGVLTIPQNYKPKSELVYVDANDNSYGHHDSKVLADLSHIYKEVKRTDTEGTIERTF